MIAEALSVLGMIYDFIDDHPDVAKMGVDRLRGLLKGHETDPLAAREAMRGLAAGMAAARANAVQAAMRRKLPIDKARAAVERWALVTTTRNQLMLNEDTKEMLAELLRDVAPAVKA